jgi:hypothetical protein
MSKTCNTTAFATIATALTVVLTLAAGSALAGTTGTEFQTMYTTLLNWGDRLPRQVHRHRRLHPRRRHRHRPLLADPGAGRCGFRAVHGLCADHHRQHHDRSRLTDDRRIA